MRHFSAHVSTWTPVGIHLVSWNKMSTSFGQILKRYHLLYLSQTSPPSANSLTLLGNDLLNTVASHYQQEDPEVCHSMKVKKYFKIGANLHLRWTRHLTESKMLWTNATWLYLERYRTKCCGNLRLGPLFSEWASFGWPSRIDTSPLSDSAGH